MAPDRKKMADEQIKNLVEMGMIRPSMSPYAAAKVFAKKNDGTARFCLDYRRINDITIKDAYPLPRIDDSLDKLSHCRYFTSLDMGSAFWQVGMDKDSIEKTAFDTQEGFYEWLRMPFGLCNATSTFQRLMAVVLSKLTNTMGNIVLCYVDDILVASHSAQDHLWKLRQVFQCLRDAGLKLKAGKCKIMEREIKFLGRLINEEGIQPDKENIDKVRRWGTPTSTKEVESFIGLANYYREYVQDFASIAAPLNRLKKKGVPFEWSDEADQAFQKLLETLTAAPILALPNDDGPFVLDTDASVVAISGVLQQYQKWGDGWKLRVIAYGSRSLRTAEVNYGAPKAEMLAAVYFMEYFRNYLLPKEFTLRCDNKAMQWLKTYSNSSPMVARWIQRLDGFHYTFVHRERGKHFNADALTKTVRHYKRIAQGQAMKGDFLPGVDFMTQEQWDGIGLLAEKLEEMEQRQLQQQAVEEKKDPPKQKVTRKRPKEEIQVPCEIPYKVPCEIPRKVPCEVPYEVPYGNPGETVPAVPDFIFIC
jgi:hypothetical protein